MGKTDEKIGQQVKLLFVHERTTLHTERYAEVTPEKQRPVLRNIYVDRAMLLAMAKAAGVAASPSDPPAAIEVTVRVIDPTQWEEITNAQ